MGAWLEGSGQREQAMAVGSAGTCTGKYRPLDTLLRSRPAAALKPRFRGRLMIPIRDIQGRVVAFTARQTELTPADDPAHEAKYVNSPETPIFTKGDLLFNLDRARTHSSSGPFVMVEGQLDALRCWHAGLKTVVAPQGTAITERPKASRARSPCRTKSGL